MAGQSPMQKIKEAGGVPMQSRPETGRGAALTLEGLKAKYGDDAGKRLYFEVAVAGGFGDFRGTPFVHYPPLDMTGLTPDAIEERRTELLARARTEDERAEAEALYKYQQERHKAVEALLAKADTLLKPAGTSAEG
jgi:hypothetical protein